jgi:hypothetical protein
VWQISCDESRVDGCKFMLFGALSIPAYAQASFDQADRNFRHATNNDLAHFKWVKAASNKKLPDYLALVDLFFNQGAFFKCLIVEKSKVDYARYHKRDHELGFYKFYFLLLSRLVKFNLEYFVRVHRRSDKNRARLIDLQAATNNWCRKTAGKHITPVRSLEGAEFTKHTELQIVDVLLGAVGYHWERMHLKQDASKPKIAICKSICTRLNKASLEFQSEWQQTKFNIWKWEPR